jgi:hypothetical protein
MRTILCALMFGVGAVACGGIPKCSTGESCAESTSHQQCLPSCAAADVGTVCINGNVCTRTSACCSGTGCSAGWVFVCCPPSGC